MSVVIPAFNSAAYLGEALDSVLAQTYQPIEVIVVDDGSEDETPQVVASYAAKVSHVSQQRGGPASARNTGIRAASGEWIAFLDADDVWMPALLDTLVKAAAKTRADLVFCDSLRLVNGKIAGPNRLVTCGLNGRLDALAPNGVLLNPFALLLEVGCYISPSSTLVKRQSLLQVGFFDEEMYGTEDIDLWLRLSLRCRFAVLDEVLVLRRMHTTNISRDLCARVTNEIKVYEKLGSYAPATALARRGHRLVRNKEAALLRERGAICLERGEALSARRSWAKSLRLSFTARVAVYWLATFLPQPWVETLRNWKAQVRGAGTSF